MQKMIEICPCNLIIINDALDNSTVVNRQQICDYDHCALYLLQI